MKETFENWSPRGIAAERVVQCDDIVNEYLAQGLKLTLRQLYYQFVARGIIENTERQLQELGEHRVSSSPCGLP